MRAIARRTDGTLKHEIDFTHGRHHLVADEPPEHGGTDEGPNPQELLAASLASCSAITMEMYAQRKGWDIGEVVVDVGYEPAQRGSPTKFQMTVRLPKELPEDQRQRLMQIVAKCPVHRTLEGEVMFDEQLELV
ncbi:MAG: putative redox protein [Thermoleophilaceae bacterium]|jgi:putative redox protein|nr:putative redox protein [Thermoleophilaceae bacterium]